MLETKSQELEYQGRKISYQAPLGIYLDGEITGRIHDSIIPKYNEIAPEKLAILNLEAIGKVRDDATRQLSGIAQQDSEEVRQAIRNTIDLTTKLLEN